MTRKDDRIGWDEWLETREDAPVNPRLEAGARTLADMMGPRLDRRALLRGAGVALAWSAGGTALAACGPGGKSDAKGKAGFGFAELAPPEGAGETHLVAAGHTSAILIRWGDPLFPDAPAFDPYNQTPEAQARQFGYNNDFIGFIPRPAKAGEDERALLCVNHEYTSRDVMFPQARGADHLPRLLTETELKVEMAAHGASIVEIVRKGEVWSVDRAGALNRRITAATPMEIAGPARASAFMRTSRDPGGVAVLGTINNCAGGITPWGTYLTSEENFNNYFLGLGSSEQPMKAANLRFGIGGATGYDWRRVDARFNLDEEPFEPHRFGWVVEIDPLDPASTPKKRTALGRFKHEGAETALAKDGRLVVYMGDDQQGEYVYKFVSRRPVDLKTPAANRDLLDEGDLYVGRFEGENGAGTLTWVKLTPENPDIQKRLGGALGREATLADVLIFARFAADAVQATPMDRPEDLEPDAATGRVFVMLTSAFERGTVVPWDKKRFALNPANPRTRNFYGHILEILEADGDLAAETATWEILVQCGAPAPDKIRDWGSGTTAQGVFSAPDNCVLDSHGRLWVATDQGGRWGMMRKSDGLYAVTTDGPARGASKLFFRCPVGAELCGPRFSPGADSLFLAVQHPATDGLASFAPFYAAWVRDFGDGDFDPSPYSSFARAATRWPDFETDATFNTAAGKPMPPRPSVVVVRREGGGVVGA